MEALTGLTLKRRIGEDIIIGHIDSPDRIVIRVCDTRGGEGGWARLLVSAPTHISVDRREVAESKRNPN